MLSEVGQGLGALQDALLALANAERSLRSFHVLLLVEEVAARATHMAVLDFEGIDQFVQRGLSRRSWRSRDIGVAVEDLVAEAGQGNDGVWAIALRRLLFGAGAAHGVGGKAGGEDGAVL